MSAKLRLDRLPIRVKLTLAYSGAIALMLVAIGAFLYLHFRSGIDDSLNQGLRARAGDLGALADGQRLPRPGQPPLVERGERFAQILDPAGRVLEASPGLRSRSLLSAEELRNSARRPLLVDRGETSRIYARRVAGAEASAIVVVGVDLDQREKALETLNGALLIGGPLALLVAAALGYLLAAGALRPVESMRKRAESITAENPEGRLPLPPADDEIHRLGVTLNHVFDRLQEALERERAFISDASHELRTPLTILKGEIEVALRRERSNAELRAALASAGEETERMTELAEALLVLARSDTDGLPLRLEEVELDRVLARAAERFATSAEHSGAEIVVEAPADQRVTADRSRLEQALDNMLENALRYGSGTVTLAARTNGAGIEIHVTDEGNGFAEEFLPRAFERFSRADRGRTGDGSGLGLAIVAAIARAHGGAARARNDPVSGGADVWISLPDATPTA